MEFDPAFKALPGGEEYIVIPEAVLATMSTDQKTSYKLCQAVRAGSLPKEMQEMQPGKLNHARWLTTAQRIVFLWTRKHGLKGKDLRVLKLLTKFCLDSYFKCYYDIKVKHSLADAPRHILTQLRILKTQPEAVKKAVTPYVKSGAWYTHTENVLLSLLCTVQS